jgi:hypothetical protein
MEACVTFLLNCVPKNLLEGNGKQSKGRSFSFKGKKRMYMRQSLKQSRPRLTTDPTALKKPSDGGSKGKALGSLSCERSLPNRKECEKTHSTLRYKNKAKKGYTNPA